MRERNEAASVATCRSARRRIVAVKTSWRTRASPPETSAVVVEGVAVAMGAGGDSEEGGTDVPRAAKISTPPTACQPEGGRRGAFAGGFGAVPYSSTATTRSTSASANDPGT
jgi:hypothetical protein